MEHYRDFELKTHNTFGIDARAGDFYIVRDAEELRSLYHQGILQKPEMLIIGGGSNILFAGNPSGPVVHPEIGGIEVLESDQRSGIIESGAGVEWDQLVDQTVRMGYYGLENLSFIPGGVGAAPVQNIGAYGEEIEQHFHSLRALDIQTGLWKEFGREECAFGYRSSIFKTAQKGRYIISSVRFKLSCEPEVNLTYDAIPKELEAMGVSSPEPMDVRAAVIRIRKSKLPDPNEYGNAGSFFKNPVVDTDTFNDICKEFSEPPHFLQEDGSVKLAAGWLIEQCGLKGYRKGKVGVHHLQALVLVNYGGAEGREVLDLAREVRAAVFDKFSIFLTPEVNIIGAEI